MLGVVSRNAGRIATAGAVIVGASAEAVLIWLVDQLPIWAQVLVYGVPLAVALAGLVLLWRQARSNKRRRARRTGAMVTRDRRAGPGTE